MTRTYSCSLAVLLLAIPGLRAEEYQSATVKSRGERGSVILNVAGKEVKVTPRSNMKAFDADGKELTEFGANYRVFKDGNVLNVKTETSRDGKYEFVREVHLVKGSLLEAGKPVTKAGKSKKSEEQVVKGATIKEYRKPYLVLTTGDQDLKLIVSNSTKMIDAANKAVAKNDRISSLKGGKVVDVTTRGTGDKMFAVEIRFQGD